MHPEPSMHKVVAVIPCYDHAQTIGRMVDAVRAHQLDAIVVDDGSHAACAEVLDGLARLHGASMTLLRLAHNQGKGGAMMAGLQRALALGYTHALQIDADGQHDVADIPKFLALSGEQPDAVVYGAALYDDCVPKARLYGRYATHVWVWINTLSLDIRDSMCGFRVYPLAPVVRLIQQTRLGRRMDFDTELLVRLHWQGLRLTCQPTRVRYPADGVSHFKLVLDNVLISRMHARMLAGMLLRLPRLLWRKVAP
ncbi:glycosyltransferase family 2 protein [Verminephrobacter aporrectodeae subsp. tuberculatae]|uniref:Glycosyltransferase family 2 protein n=2 Tax=Verminephrobacter TaxID=364316 RepID=A0ABT3KRV1_9BURK|nr:glycosyltransferase family 2 protein [Verminephrobacter aporrectodeae subsp. tuberculatae]MCW5289340.1 glycosyltransferase family 2 protein [Verminephrobacter aporrectodeae subsp. tuberculatae]MCW5320995.1 glycosyltransferase family 2 protein [Verminephrobacter aporrectodeae subsp. tuberculatae]